MIIFNVANPFTLLLLLAILILLVFLSHELKKSYIVAIPLFASLILLVVHAAQLFTLEEAYMSLAPTLSNCVVVDFAFVAISFFTYLWVDDIEAKTKGKKDIDPSISWLWKNI